MQEPTTIQLDEETYALYILVPKNRVVLLQSIFELYEGLGTLRTVDIRKSLLCILCTKSLLKKCMEALQSIKSEINWRPAEKSAISLDDYLQSYGQKQRQKNRDI